MTTRRGALQHAAQGFTYYAMAARVNRSILMNTINTRTTPSCATTTETPRLVALPRINILKFDGYLEFWPAYREC
ncbi:hypothetical protein M0802_012313 [Mischocyttarus mexicanus]|nr:hypothetical protein M0802_012313 [Mischocyttarus mexicanus]